MLADSCRAVLFGRHFRVQPCLLLDMPFRGQPQPQYQGGFHPCAVPARTSRGKGRRPQHVARMCSRCAGGGGACGCGSVLTL